MFWFVLYLAIGMAFAELARANLKCRLAYLLLVLFWIVIVPLALVKKWS